MLCSSFWLGASQEAVPPGQEGGLWQWPWEGAHFPCWWEKNEGPRSFIASQLPGLPLFPGTYPLALWGALSVLSTCHLTGVTLGSE